MIVAKDKKRKGSYDALRSTEEQEREPEGMPELDREALCDDSIVEECDEDDTSRDNKKKKSRRDAGGRNASGPHASWMNTQERGSRR